MLREVTGQLRAASQGRQGRGGAPPLPQRCPPGVGHDTIQADALHGVNLKHALHQQQALRRDAAWQVAQCRCHISLCQPLDGLQPVCGGGRGWTAASAPESSGGAAPSLDPLT